MVDLVFFFHHYNKIVERFLYENLSSTWNGIVFYCFKGGGSGILLVFTLFFEFLLGFYCIFLD